MISSFFKDYSVSITPTKSTVYTVGRHMHLHVSNSFVTPLLSSLLKGIAVVSLYCWVTVLPVQAAVTAPVYSVLHNFDIENEGGFPLTGVTIGTDGSLYGTTNNGGANNRGTVWKINTAGVFSILHHFDDSYGFNSSNVALGGDGSVYGIVQSGGSIDSGDLWKINPAGVYSVLHHFDTSPSNEFILASDGSFYGKNPRNPFLFRSGIVWKFNPASGLSVLRVLDASIGKNADFSLVGRDNSLYGVSEGGLYNKGTVWKIDSAGVLTVLHDFDGINGSFPDHHLVLGNDGSLYGHTLFAERDGSFNGGVVWKINPAGAYSVLHYFDEYVGSKTITLGSDGSLYGTTERGVVITDGISSNGTIWKIDTTGVFSVLHNFDNSLNGFDPFSSLTLTGDGRLYGTALRGGSGASGVVYRFTLPASNVPGDISGDGKVDCADIKALKFSFGKKLGQPGFNAKADTNNDNLINIRDLVFVSRRLPNGLICS